MSGEMIFLGSKQVKADYWSAHNEKQIGRNMTKKNSKIQPQCNVIK
jgi:hypothetical protein